MAKPLNSLASYIQEDGCGANHLSDDFALDPVPSAFSICSLQTSHLTGCEFSLLHFVQRPGLTQISEGGDKDCVDQTGSDLLGYVWVLQQGC